MCEIDKNRINNIKTGDMGFGPVIYIMARDQRVDNNWALLFAQQLALQQKQPMVVACPIAADYPKAPPRQIDFIMSGLLQVDIKLRKLGIPFIVSHKSVNTALTALIKNNRFGALVTDFNPLKESRAWKNKLARKISVPFFEVDSHNIVPCWQASNKQEYAAYTIRPKINRLLDKYLTAIPNPNKHPFPFNSDDIHLPKGWSGISDLPGAKTSNTTILAFEPGEKAAQKRLRSFFDNGLENYNAHRNNPAKSAQSDLSPYLHFGQLSAQRIALEAQRYDYDLASLEAFLEELVVRRELADNYCYYNENYDSFNGFPVWAQKTLDDHRNDPRPYLYDKDALESADTHDELWNTAQKEMIITGKMHGYMRMYWAKKILEWSISPEEAMANAAYLNDKYELDGNDPNGYTGIAWSIGGVHDRAWAEREIFGKIRYMSYNGCRRKFSITDYVNRIAGLNTELIT